MAIAVNILTHITAAAINMIKVSGNVTDAGKNPVARTVHIYDSGTSNLRETAESNGTSGDYEVVIPGEPANELRVEAFADETPGDENSQVHDFVNPVQHTKLV